MNKKNIIFLIIAIIIFIGALGLFIYAKSLDSKPNNETKTVAIDTTTPDLSQEQGPYFYDIDGNKLSFDEFTEKPSVIFLWKSDNSKSYTIINLITNYYEEYKDKINFLSINVNESDIDLDLIENVKAANFSIPIYFDTDLTIQKEYNYDKLPKLFFINKDGTIAQEVEETIDEDTFSANLELLTVEY